MKQWEIVELRQNKFDAKERKPDDPEALYSWEIRKTGTTIQTGSCIKFEELKKALKKYDSNSPSKLEGIVFEVPKECIDGKDAFDYFIGNPLIPSEQKIVFPWDC